MVGVRGRREAADFEAGMTRMAVACPDLARKKAHELLPDQSLYLGCTRDSRVTCRFDG